jgi:transposase
MHGSDLRGRQRALIEDPFPSTDGGEGEPWRDHRMILNGVFRVLHTGRPRRDLSGRYGPWQAAYDRFARYRRDGTLDAILERLRARLDRLGRIDRDFWCFDGTSGRAAGRAAGAGKRRASAKPSATAAAGSAASRT